jgi:hypothetical protein
MLISFSHHHFFVPVPKNDHIVGDTYKMNNMCKYILPRNSGVKCNDKKCHYKSHQSLERQHTYRVFVGEEQRITEKNILDCISHSWSYPLNKDTIIGCILYLFDTYTLIGIGKALGIRCFQRTKKIVIADKIADLGIHLAQFSQNKKLVTAITGIQRKWRRYLHGDTQHASNNDDPFTLVAIKDIPSQDSFAYKDPHGNIWAFRAEDLYYHIVTNSETNPYTRENIPENDLRRLGIIMKGRTSMHFSLDSCTTVDQMFTYVLSFYESEGFYLQNQWFHSLNIHDLEIVKRVVYGDSWNTITSHKEFANFMLHVVHNVSDPLRFPRICLLIATVGHLIPEMEEALPDWVFASAQSITQ